MENNIAQLADEQLVLLYANGENKAFDILLNRHKNKIHSYIYFIVKDYDLTEDIFQETFVKAIMTLKQGKYTENGKFSAWITRIAHNLIIDFYRQEKNEKWVSDDELSSDIFNRKELSEETIEEVMVRSQIHDDVRRLVDSLPDNQREVLIMRYYQNLSFKEIADQTQVSINTALGRMRYAIMNIRKLAEEKNIILTI